MLVPLSLLLSLPFNLSDVHSDKSSVLYKPSKVQLTLGCVVKVEARPVSPPFS